MRSFPKIVFLTSAILFFSSLVWAGRLNIPSDSNGGRICRVTSMTDQNVYGSLRRALEQGYNQQDSDKPSFCTEKIVFETGGKISLNRPILLNNRASESFILEKASNVREDVILDASGLKEAACAIEIDSNNVTLKGISILNAPGSGICIMGNSDSNLIDNVMVTRSKGNGILIMKNSQQNTIRRSRVYNNDGYGVRLVEASQNRVTRNSIYGNDKGAIDSDQTNIIPELISASPVTSQDESGQVTTRFSIRGKVPVDVERVELFRSNTANNSSSTYLTTVKNGSKNSFTGRSFNVQVDAQPGERVFAVAIAADGSTSPSSALIRLSSTGTSNSSGSGSGSGSKGKVRDCVPDQIFAPTDDFDGDGIFDVVEDKNADCLVQYNLGETNPAKADTDGDGLDDGVEDFNRNGIVDEGESDPRTTDTDGDRLSDYVEDRNHDGVRQTDELDPTKADTDGDGINDFIEDANHNGEWDEGTETDGTRRDTDQDGLDDGQEDKDRNGSVGPDESDPRKRNSDGDRLDDDVDPCPLNPSLNCKEPCIPGLFPPESLDNDSDGLPDLYEDLNHDCVKDAGETDPFNRDTDGDNLVDPVDSCPNNPDRTCVGDCTPDLINSFTDSDNDGLVNTQEDVNGNCFVDQNETDPFDADSDNDGTNDGFDTCPLDDNPLCSSQCRPGITPPEEQDSDGDGIPDVNEDINKNCIQDTSETNFRKRDTDGDGTNDNQDVCPLDPDPTCTNACIPGEFIAPQRDSDRDGIKDVLEDANRNCIREVNETDSYNPDSDGDGLADGMEDRNQNGILDPGETDPRMVDTDRDGIPDGVEDTNKNGFADFDELDPTKTDTDEDGIPDFLEDRNLNGIFELNLGETNGARKDTDQDGLDDGVEDRNFNGIVDAGETDPRNPDTDGDGANDGQEVIQGTNPIHASNSDFNRAVGQGCSLNMGLAIPDLSLVPWIGMMLVGLAFRIRKHR